jgi:hypothetical protein
MPKWILFVLAALLDFVLAFFAYRDGRTFIMALLIFAGLSFIIAAIGSAKKSKSV